MELSDQDVREFQQLYKEEFGEEIDFEQAYSRAVKMLRLLELVYKPAPEERSKSP